MVKTIDSESLKTEPSDLQRWEDEGGQMYEHEFKTDRPLAQSVPITAGRHARSLQWNERFVIEPFQPGNGILLIRQKPTTKID